MKIRPNIYFLRGIDDVAYGIFDMLRSSYMTGNNNNNNNVIMSIKL